MCSLVKYTLTAVKQGKYYKTCLWSSTEYKLVAVTKLERTLLFHILTILFRTCHFTGLFFFFCHNRHFLFPKITFFFSGIWSLTYYFAFENFHLLWIREVVPNEPVQKLGKRQKPLLSSADNPHLKAANQNSSSMEKRLTVITIIMQK